MTDSTLKPGTPARVLAAGAALLAVAIPAAALLALSIAPRVDNPLAYLAATLLGVLAILMVLLRPQLGVCLLFVSVVLNVSGVFADVNKPLVLLVLFGLALNRLLRRHGPRPLTAVEGWMLAYWAVWLASYFVAREHSVTLSLVVDFAKDLAILFLAVNALETRTDWKLATWTVIASAGLLAAMGAYQTLTGNYNQTFLGFASTKVVPVVSSVRTITLTGPIGDANFYGQVLAAALPLALYRVLTDRRWLLRIAGSMAGLVILYTAIHTYSRGTFLAIACTLLVVARERRIRLRLLLLAVPIVVVTLPFLPTGYLDRLGTLSWLLPGDSAVAMQEDSFRGRFTEAMTGVVMFADHPLLGIGAGNYAVRYQEYAGGIGTEYRSTERQAHSMYIEAAAETGIVGLVVLTAIFAVLFSRLERARRVAVALRDMDWSIWLVSLEISIGSYLITSIFLHRDYIRYLWLLVTLAVTALHLTPGAQVRRNGSPIPVEEVTP